MDNREQKKQAKQFIKRWENRGNERQDSQSFWLDLLSSVYGIENPANYISFEDKVMLDHTSFMDAYISKTNVMIEQKGSNKDLNKAIKQSDGSFLTPFQQAKRYSANLPYSQRPRWIITCNFKEFYIYDMEQPNAEAIIIKLADLEKEYYRLEFLVDKDNEHLEREMQISIQAGEIVGEIYNGLIKQYINADSPETLHAINQLIVRLVFCLYAEDSGIFGHKLIFHDYLAQYSTKHFRRALLDLFDVLNTPIDKRDPYLDDDLAQFPYVNGGMFAEIDMEVPNFTDELRTLILDNASSGFDWSSISPTIFGAVFESTLNPETRRSGGMHYTSIENIHKVIDPLFLDELKNELNEIRQFKLLTTVEQKAKNFQLKLAKLTFFDPACGSGNFLTETYLSLRRLENEAIKLYMGDSVSLDLGQDLVKVKLSQFYGIEINDFAVSVAKTALWIAESQMLEETKEIVFSNIDFLPLKSYTNIVEGNALTVEWEEIVPKEHLNFIIGNPPFVGAKYANTEQKKSIELVNKKLKGVDLVSCWFYKAAEFAQGTNIEIAFVSTNSITQGQQISVLWEFLLFEFKMKINFAYRTFAWKSEADEKAAVHCVIISYSSKSRENKYIFDGNTITKVHKISPYLVSGTELYIPKARRPLCDVPIMIKGSQPTDGGNLILNEDDKNELIKLEPKVLPYIKKYMGASDLIKNTNRYCLWLKECTPAELKQMPTVLKRLEKVRISRLNSSKISTQKWADFPYLFTEDRQPLDDYLMVPVVSSQNRRYIPMDFVSKNIIANTNAQVIPGSNIFHFAILSSNVHMAWMRVVAGRMKSDYAYSATIVYNNFPWPSISSDKKTYITKTGQAILDARKLYPDSSLADLYDELTMPKELRRAHQINDKAVMEAYGFIKTVDGKKTWLSESETVSKLFEMYEELISK
ncbi:DNA methyltransferase [Streptococcus parauberis]|uniref:DNA methyltransferase n=1 Tax=Streptococcus parauberis TaxID=1348 RepID=UPI00379B3B81